MSSIPRGTSLIGMKFGRLTVVDGPFKDIKNHNSLWSCECSCGKSITIKKCRLVHGTQSCGCLWLETISKSNSTHRGTCDHPGLYAIWSTMRQRCSNKNNTRSHRYVNRGIRVCDEWENSFKAFLDWSLTNGYRKGLTLDRENNNGNYEPSNCRWATYKTQANNRNKNILLTAFGKTKTTAEWSEDPACQVRYDTLLQRIQKLKWSDHEKAITKAPQKPRQRQNQSPGSEHSG